MNIPTKYFDKKPMSEYLEELQPFFGHQFLVPVIGMDDGYAQYNSAYLVVDSEGSEPKLKIVEDKMPSLGRRGRHTMGMMGGTVNLYSAPDSNEEYTITPFVQSPEDTRNKDYPASSLNLFLTHAALDRIGLAGKPCVVMTGLPLEQFMDGDDAVNSLLIRRKVENTKRPVYIGTDREASAKIVHTAVYPEAVAGMVDYLIDEFGQMREGIDPNVIRLAIDIGGNTTDLAILLPGNQVGARKTLEYGVKHVKDVLRQLIIKRFSLDPDDALLEQALKTKEIQWFGETTEDVASEVDSAIATVMQPILEEIDSFKKQFPSLREIVGFGGGVALMQTVICEKYPNIIVMENPDGANARGFLKCAVIYELDSIMACVKKALDQLQQQIETAQAGEPA